VPGDAKALVVLDFNHDGWPDFLISRNNGSTLAFRNQPILGFNFLRVQLRGTAGNPKGIGAHIALTLSDGSIQTSEVYAGSGYYSQSTTNCFFGFPDHNPPKKIRVRWPSGEFTEQDLASGLVSLTIPAPTVKP
jgi:enediyne biosynthesis protein E4